MTHIQLEILKFVFTLFSSIEHKKLVATNWTYLPFESQEYARNDLPRYKSHRRIKFHEVWRRSRILALNFQGANFQTTFGQRHLSDGRWILGNSRGTTV